MRYLLLILLILSSCGGTPTPPIQPTATTVTTSAGIRVTSASTVSLGHLAEIDRQYDELLRIASTPPNNYEVFPTPEKIQIFIVARNTGCKQISFSIVENVPRGTNYDGTEFDLDGQVNGQVELCVAGRYNQPRTALRGTCPQGSDSIEVTADGIVQTDIVRYELEHWLLYRVDCARFWETAIHQGSGHPILGEGGVQRATKEVVAARDQRMLQ